MPRTPPDARRLILRGYGPLAGLVCLVLLVTILVPSRPQDTDDGVAVAPQAQVEPERGAAAGVPAGEVGAAGSGGVPGGADEADAGPAAGPAAAPAVRPATAPARARTGTAPATSAKATGPVPTPRTASGPVAATGLPAGVRRAANCSGGALQDANSTYSPPCLAFAGDNGGATSRGVTAEEITVAWRDVGNPLAGGDGTTELEKTAGSSGVFSSVDAQRRTRDAMLEYFNRTFQLYGRKVKLVEYKGRGNLFNELASRGQAEANADALKVEQEIKAFADLSALTIPYFDALVRHKVITFSAGFHMPPAYYRSPYAWGVQVDCTTLMNSAVALLAKRLPPTGNADRAGSASLRAKPRKYGLLLPDDSVYAQCVEQARPAFKAAGIEIAKEVRYAADLAQMQLQAPSIAGQLKIAGVSTVMVLTADGGLPFFLTPAATQQDFWPEWFLTGSSYTDTDAAGQLCDQRQWQNALGQSFMGEFRDGKTSESWRAYRAVRPDDEPTLTRDLDYYPMIMLFLGLQMAGPNLTPATFQQGMYAYGRHAGPAGAWSFGPDDHTSADDAREIYYDAKAVSPFNNRPGRFVSPAGDRRYGARTWPSKDPGVPVPPPAAA